MNALLNFFSSSELMPHGYCLEWRADIFWLHVVSDATIALAYFSIPAAIAVFASRREQVRHRWILWMFVAFVLACGMTHALGIWTMWFPDYAISGLAKAITALISIATAALLWPLIPRALRIPSVDELERRVAERTAALVSSNDALRREIDHRRAVEQELIQARDDAEAANRAKSAFLSVMSHELRTPLNAIMGYSQLIRLRVADGQPITETATQGYLGHIHDSGQHLLALIEDVLDVSQIESGRLAVTPQSVNVAEITTQAIAVLQPAAQEKFVTLRHATVSGPVRAGADPVRLKQVISNLVSNAIKYNDAGGSVDISTTATENGGARIIVTDNGWGVPEEYRHELFQPFARLGRETGAIPGTGVGLALTQRIVRLMEGTVTYQPAPNGGSIFTVDLPAWDGAEEAVAAAETATSGNEARPRKPAITASVLYVEDNPPNASLMRQVFETALPDAALEIASTGRQGIEAAKRARPDLIMLDLELPDMAGTDVLIELRAFFGEDMPRVIIVSADATDHASQRVADHGGLEFMTKPFRLGDLVDTITNLVIAPRPITPP